MRLLLAAAAALAAASTASAGIITVSSEPGWYDGRATFFGASKQLQDSFEKIRGPGSYGDLHYGSCGYFDKPQVGEGGWWRWWW